MVRLAQAGEAGQIELDARVIEGEKIDEELRRRHEEFVGAKGAIAGGDEPVRIAAFVEVEEL
ncbi:hypothetical protein D3C83_316020 [compost metagenome]